MRKIEIGLAKVVVENNWRVTHCNLSEIDPAKLEQWEQLDLAALWPWHFVQDLLQIEKLDGRFIIDVSWIPEGELNGEYLVDLIGQNELGEWDWGQPIESERTRSLEKLLARVLNMSKK